MKLYTICLRDVPTLVISTDADKLVQERVPEGLCLEDRREIDEAVDGWLGKDLRTLEHNGQPLWDGSPESVSIRAASDDEANRWRSSFREAISGGEEDARQENWILYLVRVSDPTDADC